MEDATYWAAFRDLSSERSLGMGVGSVPRSAIARYGAEVLGLEDEALDQFIAVIRAVDDDYVSMVNTPRDRLTATRADDTDGVANLLEALARAK